LAAKVVERSLKFKLGNRKIEKLVKAMAAFV
jgi:hypothetical protein